MEFCCTQLPPVGQWRGWLCLFQCCLLLESQFPPLSIIAQQALLPSKKSTTKVIENEVEVSKPICIKDKLYNKALCDFVGITAGTQLYFALGSIKRKERPTVDKSLLGEDYLPGLLQTWMSVDFHLPTVCKQHNLLVSNLKVK